MPSSCRVCSMHCNAGIDFNDICCIPNQTAVTYLEALCICTSLEASAGDELPQLLCLECTQNLKTAYQFICTARQTDRLLRGLAQTDLENCEDPLEGTLDDEVVFDASFDVSEVPTDCFKSEGENDTDDGDDDKPLKYLLSSEAFQTHQLKIRSTEDLLDKSFVDDAYAGHIEDNSGPTLVLPQGEQIFPQGLYQCTECDKHYFTRAGLESHNEIHLPAGASAKKKRLQKPRKKSTKIDKDISSLERDDAAEEPCINNEDNNSAAQESAQLTEKPPKSRQKKPPKPKKLFPCHECGKHMISASKLRYHMVMHTGEKDYLCTMCPKAYSTIYALKHHIRTHTGERPYECKFCGDKFLRPTTLKSHMRRHTGERPYGCSICGKRFIQHSSMTTHMKLNHMAKTIQCPHCDKKYARQTDLNTHLLSHTGNKPFSCSLCPSRFIRQANLNKHLNQQHFTPKTSTTKAKKLPATQSSIEVEILPVNTYTLDVNKCTETQGVMGVNGGDGNESAHGWNTWN